MRKLHEWLSFLAEYKLEAVYAFIIGVAQSGTDLRHLHDTILPGNYRLMREDIIDLVRAWRVAFPGRTVSENGRPTDEQIELLVLKMDVTQIIGGTYYLRKLGKGTIPKPETRGHCKEVFTSSTQLHRGSNHIECKLFSLSAKISVVRVMREKPAFVCTLGIPSYELTEASTHQLNVMDSQYHLRFGEFSCSTRSSFRAICTWELSAERYAEHLPDWQAIHLFPASWFLSLLKEHLNELGAPVKDLRAIIYEVPLPTNSKH